MPTSQDDIEALVTPAAAEAEGVPHGAFLLAFLPSASIELAARATYNSRAPQMESTLDRPTKAVGCPLSPRAQ